MAAISLRECATRRDAMEIGFGVNFAEYTLAALRNAGVR
jgi:hypothetical protein